MFWKHKNVKAHDGIETKEGRKTGRQALINKMYKWNVRIQGTSRCKGLEAESFCNFPNDFNQREGKVDLFSWMFVFYLYIYLFLIMWPLHKPWHNAGVALSLLFTLIPIVLFCVPDLVSCLRGVLFDKGYSVSPWLLLARIFHYWVLFQLPPVGIAKLKSDQVLAGWEEIMQLNTQLHSSPVLDNKWE